jgi:hypothetical protein
MEGVPLMQGFPVDSIVSIADHCAGCGDDTWLASALF